MISQACLSSPRPRLYIILPLSGVLVLLNAVLVAARQDKKIFPENSPEKEDHNA